MSVKRKIFPEEKNMRQVPERLQREWVISGVCALCWGLLWAWFLSLAWQALYAWRWFGQMCVGLVYVFSVLRRLLWLNIRQQDGKLMPALGPGTIVTLVRGVLLSMLAGFLFLPWPGLTERSWLAWLPGICYLLAGCADYLDGYLARVTHCETRLGALFDTKLDAFGLVVAPLLAVLYGQLPRAYLLVSLAYYALNAGRWARKRTGKPVFEVAPWAGARVLAGFQMGLVGLALLPLVSPAASTMAASVFMLPFLGGFLRDWGVSCGTINPASREWQRRETRLKTVLLDILPLGLRILLAILGGSLIWRRLTEGTLFPLTQSDAFRGAVWMLLIFGLAGRIAACGLSLSLAVRMNASSGGLQQMIFICVVAVLLSGTGRFSCWQPEERLLFQRLGG